MAKEYGRKAYTSNRRYPDFIYEITSRAVWNQITEQDRRLSEFSGSDTPLSAFDRTVLQYLKQSERKKPYLPVDYNDMEYNWEGFVPGIWPDIDWPNLTDFPWRTPGGTGGGFTAFSLNVTGCYCCGSEIDVDAKGTHPITGIQPSFGSITNIQIISPTYWKLTIWAPADCQGLMEFEAFMISTTSGAGGNAFDSIIGCGEWQCCENIDAIAWDEATSAETMGASDTAVVAVTGGKGTYTWTVSGTGATLQSLTTSGGSNTVITDSSACGTITITCTDACGTETTGYIRVTDNSSWQEQGSRPNCVMGGTPDNITEYITSTSVTFYRIVGGQKQTETIAHIGSATGGCCDCTCASNDCDCNNAAYTANGGGCSPCFNLPGSFNNSSYVCRFQVLPFYLYEGTVYCTDYPVNRCVSTISCGGDYTKASWRCYASTCQAYELWLCNP